MTKFNTKFEPHYGQALTLSPLIRRIVAHNPSPYTFHGTGTYLIGHEEIAVIDPGPKDHDHIQNILNVAQGKISHILITHNHTDHSPGARLLQKETGAPIYGYEAFPITTAKGQSGGEGLDRDYRPDQALADGDILKSKEWTIEAIHTPGHLPNHLCFALQEENALFSGDHVMGWSTTVVIPPYGSMGDYMHSLKKIEMRNEEIFYPTHGNPIKAPQRFTRSLYNHRRLREDQILKQLRSGAQSVEQMVPELYPSLDPRLILPASMSVTAHLVYLVEKNKVAQSLKDGTTYYSLI